jgi:hypothetical protein
MIHDRIAIPSSFEAQQSQRRSLRETSLARNASKTYAVTVPDSRSPNHFINEFD